MGTTRRKKSKKSKGAKSVKSETNLVDITKRENNEARLASSRTKSEATLLKKHRESSRHPGRKIKKTKRKKKKKSMHKKRDISLQRISTLLPDMMMSENDSAFASQHMKPL